jgi:hypothetical protein
MLVEGQKLRWWRIDMRPRWRRRAAVLLTYFLIFVAGATLSVWNNHPIWAMFCFAVGTMIVVRLSVMRENGIVKGFDGKAPIPVRGYGKMIFVEGLDEWAQYHYGVSNFEAASPAQQDELLSRFKMGKRLFPAKPDTADAPWLDEREKKERDSAERWSMKVVMGILASYAGIYTSRSLRRKVVEPLEVAFEFFMFAVLLWTLPRARVLWTEPDPREFGDEMALVPGPEQGMQNADSLRE